MIRGSRKDTVIYAAKTYGPLVIGIAVKRLGSRSEADDVFQEVFESLYTSATTFQNADHLKHWLIRATVNRCKNRLRYYSRHPDLPVDPADLSGLSSECQREMTVGYESVGCETQISDYIEKLPVDLRNVVELFYFEGYGAQEISTMLNIPPVTVRTRLYRARKQLKSMMDRRF